MPSAEIRWTDSQGAQRFALIGPTSNRPGCWAWLEYRGAGVFDEDSEPSGANYGHSLDEIGEKLVGVLAGEGECQEPETGRD